MLSGDNLAIFFCCFTFLKLFECLLVSSVSMCVVYACGEYVYKYVIKFISM